MGASSIMAALSDLKKIATSPKGPSPSQSGLNIMVQVTHGPVENNPNDPVVVDSPVPLVLLVQELLRHVGGDRNSLQAIIDPLLNHRKLKFESEGRFKRLEVLISKNLSITEALRVYEDCLIRIRP